MWCAGSADEVFAGEFEFVEAAEEGDGDAVGVEEGLGLLLNLVGGNGIEAVEDFFDGEEVVEVHFLPGEIGHAGGGAFEAEEDVALDLLLGAAELFGGEECFFEAFELGHDEGDHFEGFVGGCAGVDAERAGVGVGAEVGVDGVGHAALFADGLEEAGAHAAAEDGVEDEGCVAVFVGDFGRWDAEAELDLLKGALAAQDDGRAFGGRGEVDVGRAGGERGEFFGDGLDELVVVELSGGGEDHVAATEALAVVAEEGVLVEGGDGFRGAEDGLAEGLVFPEVLGEELVDEDVGVVFVDFDFLEDDAALALDVGMGEGGVEDQVGEDVEGDGDVVVEGLDAEADSFLAGVGVEVAADGVHFTGDVLGGSGAGAFEEHVLDEMGDAVGGGLFIARAGFDPDAHGDGAEVLHAFGENGEPVGQDGAAKIAFRGQVAAPGNVCLSAD